MEEVTITFNPDGSADLQGVEGKDVEKLLPWLFKSLGRVTKRGHKHVHKSAEGLGQEQKRG